MKKHIHLLITFLIPVFGFSQADSISFEPGYTNQVYYSFANGEVKSSDNTTWDLAFGIGGFNTDIRINDGFGVELYLYPNGDTAEWNNMDTNGLQNWTPRYNSDTSWTVTAFAAANINHPDYGWGIYNSTTHEVLGDSIYILKLTDGTLKKFKMNSMTTSGEFTFSYANIDGTNQVDGTINKLAYTGKNFVYYSVKTDAILDLEPMASEWDIVFTKYMQLQPQGGFYPVTGVLTNKDRNTAESRAIDLADADWYGHDYSSEIGIIGGDWKKFNMTTYTYDIVDSLTYFMTDTNNNVFQITFTGFAGSSTGMTYFNVNKVGNLSIENTTLAINNISVYPNPAIDFVNISIDSKDIQNNLDITVYSITGSVVYQTRENFTGNNLVQIPVNNWQKGVYLIRIGNDANAVVKRVIVN